MTPAEARAEYQYAVKFRRSPAFQAGVAHPRGQGWYYTDPLVVYLLHEDPKFVEHFNADSNGNLSPIVAAVDSLDGFEMGWWEAIKRSASALAHALADDGADFTDVYNAMYHTLAATYDARQSEREAFHAQIDQILSGEAPGDPALATEQARVRLRLQKRATDDVRADRTRGRGRGWKLLAGAAVTAVVGRAAGWW